MRHKEPSKYILTLQSVHTPLGFILQLSGCEHLEHNCILSKYIALTPNWDEKAYKISLETCVIKGPTMRHSKKIPLGMKIYTKLLDMISII